MKKQSAHVIDDIPDILRDELAATRILTPETLDALGKANRALQENPSFSSDVLKGLFINEMLTALEERNETKAKLADRIGKSRQYVQKLFNEDKRVNFTVDTLCDVAYALGRRIHIHVCKADEAPMILTVMKRHVAVTSWDKAPATRREPWMDHIDFDGNDNANNAKEVNHEGANAA